MLMLFVSFCCWVWFADLVCLFSYLYCADVCSIMLVNLYLIGVCCDLLVWGICLVSLCVCLIVVLTC